MLVFCNRNHLCVRVFTFTSLSDLMELWCLSVNVSALQLEVQIQIQIHIQIQFVRVRM